MVVLDAEQEPAWQRESIKMTNKRSVPQVFINSQHIGGCDDTVALDRSGDLKAMLD